MYLAKQTMVGPLQTLILSHPESRLLDPTDRGYLCFFHGYGASASNLRPLFDALQLPKQISILLPNAPIQQSVSMEFESFAWWPLDLERLMNQRKKATTAADLEALCTEVPTGLTAARKSVLSWFAALEKDHIIHKNAKIVIGGFSQGAMLATDIALHATRQIHGLCVLSGGLINQEEWETAMRTSQKIPRFQSHGTDDDILPFSLGMALHNCLQKGPLHGDFLAYEGAHTITQEVVAPLKHHICKSLETA